MANKAILAVLLVALLCTAVHAQGPLSKVTNAIGNATKSVTDTVDKGVNGTKTAVSTVTNTTKGVGEGVKGAAEAIGNIGKKSAAGFAAPAAGVFAAAGFGTLLLLAL